jgi:hypothetical protein
VPVQGDATPVQGDATPVQGDATPVQGDAGSRDSGPSAPPPDILPLNSLLTAEFSLIRAYQAVMPVLQNPPVGDPLAANGPVLGAIAESWLAHHREHAAALVAAINALGGTPVSEASVTFTPPTGFTPNIRNAMVLLCNFEKGASVAYNRSVAAMTAASSRYLATIIEGAETQHFLVLYGLLKQVLAPNPANLITMINEVAPKAFVNNVGGMSNGLQSIAPFTSFT